MTQIGSELVIIKSLNHWAVPAYQGQSKGNCSMLNKTTGNISSQCWYIWLRNSW